jgi:hypothetical protein
VDGWQAGLMDASKHEWINSNGSSGPNKNAANFLPIGMSAAFQEGFSSMGWAVLPFTP